MAKETKIPKEVSILINKISGKNPKALEICKDLYTITGSKRVLESLHRKQIVKGKLVESFKDHSSNYFSFMGIQRL